MASSARFNHELWRFSISNQSDSATGEATATGGRTISTQEDAPHLSEQDELEKALWTFVRVEGVEPTNNHAERALMRAVLRRRKPFGTQSEAGSRFVERILTVVTSLRQQSRDVLEYLTAACERQSCCLLP